MNPARFGCRRVTWLSRHPDLLSLFWNPTVTVAANYQRTVNHC